MTTQPDVKQTILTGTVQERAILYARVSSDDRKNEGGNLKGQIEMGRSYAASNNYSIITELSEDDRGDSGYDIDLPQLNKVREMAHAGQFDVLVVREIDRLSRNLAKQLIVEEELKRAGVRIEYVLGEYPDTAEGRLQKHIKGSIAEYEREKIKERMYRGKLRQINNGYVMTSQAPFGYNLSIDKNGNATFEVNSVESEIVRYIFQQFVDGLTIGKIQKALTNSDIPTPSDLKAYAGRGRKTERGQWGRATVAKILKNETYAGVWYFGKENKEKYRKPDGTRGYKKISNPRSQWKAVEVPAIINRIVYDYARQRLTENKERRGKRKAGEYLLSKRITCSKCGRKMAGTKIKAREQSWEYYYCPSNRKEDIWGDCDQKYIRKKLVDDTVWNWLQGILSDKNKLKEELDAIEARKGSKNTLLQKQLEAANQQIQTLEQELKDLLNLAKGLKSGGRAYAAVMTDIERVEDTITKLEAQQQQIKTQIEGIALTEEKRKQLEFYAAKVAEGVEVANIDFDLRRQIIETLDLSVNVHNEEEKVIIEVTYFLYDDSVILSTSM